MDRTRVLQSFGKLPLFFEKNEGQTDGEVKYFSRGHGYGLYLTDTEAVLSLRGTKPAVEHRHPAEEKPQAPPTERTARLRMKLVGGNPASVVSAIEELPGKSNYFIGQDPRRWRTDVPHYARVSYAAVYPGVDLVYHGRQGRLEYDFVVSAGADPRQIRMRLDGGEGLQLDEAGNLVIETGQGRLVQEAPYVYQEVAGERRQVAGGYVLHGGVDVGFEVGPYDATRPLVIDPVLAYSTYLGGSGADYGEGVAVDASGSAYVTGTTQSTNFPTSNPYQTDRGSTDAFVTKLSPSGSSLVYSTYLGGSLGDLAHAIAVDASGNAYVTGETDSADFPTLNPYQTNRRGVDAFVTKLSPSGSSLVYSTYLGGTSTTFTEADYGYAIAVDAAGSAYVAGETDAQFFPTVNAYEADPQGGRDAFVTKFSPSGTSLVFSTYLGGGSDDSARAIVVDGSGSAYVAGFERSTNFPTWSAYQATHRGGLDAFVTKFSPSGFSVVYSTYLGGSDDDSAYGIAVDASGRAYVAGETVSSDFPTLNPYQSTKGGGVDAFVTRFSPSGSSVTYSTYLGGAENDFARSVAVDVSASAHVAGFTFSTNFPTLNPYQTDQGAGDAFVTRFSPSGSSLAYSTYLGGIDGDFASGIAVDASGNSYVTGQTSSTDFPTLTPYQTDQGSIDVFVTKLETSLPPPTLSVLDVSVPEGNSGTSQAVFTIQLSYPSTLQVTVGYATSDGTAAAGSDYVAATGTVTVTPGQTVATFPVTINGDLADEPDETLAVTLSNPQNATIADGSGQGTITDDDPLPMLGINDVSVAEGNAGSVNAVFTASLTGLTERTVTVQFATADDTATEPGDYSFASGTLTFTPGQTSLPITVAVNGDTVAEAIETFFVNLTLPTNAALGDGQGRGTIFDDDGANFYTLTPCRVLDTRTTQPLATGVDRTIPITGLCNVPPTARAVSLNIAVTSPTASGFVKLFPAGGAVPVTAAINFAAGQTRANNGIYGLGTGGAIVGRYGPVAGTAHLILDVNGYFE